MKVLIHSTYYSSFLEKIIYRGLCENIGKKNTYVYKPSLFDSGNNLISNVPDSNIINSDEIVKKLDNYDLLLFFNDSFLDGNFYKILNKKTNTIKIFIDGIDDFFIRRIYKHPEIAYYFKRELYDTKIPEFQKFEWIIRYVYELSRTPGTFKKKQKWFSYWNIPIGMAYKRKFQDVFPMPLTINNPKNNKVIKDKEYYISFIGHLNNPERTQYFNLLKIYLKTNNKKNFLSSNITTMAKYEDIIKKSKVGLSIRGTGFDTWRYWEIPCYGTALLAQKTPILIPKNFIDGESALFFNDFNELKYKFLKYVVNSDEWMEIARKGQERFLEYHTPKKRVQYLLNVIEGNE